MAEEMEPEVLGEKIRQLKEKRKKRQNYEFLRSLGLVWALGIIMVSSIYGGYRIGEHLDRLKGGGIFYTALFMILGILVGSYAVYHLLKPFLKEK